MKKITYLIIYIMCLRALSQFSNRIVSDLIGGIFIGHHYVILAIRDTLFVSGVISLDKFVVMSDKVEDL